MKLLMCTDCDSIFKLTLTLRSCECGKVKGRYEPDGSHAVVNGEGYSLAIGNGSFLDALSMGTGPYKVPEWRNNKEWHAWWMMRPGNNMFLAWARPHADDSNSHTRVDPNL